MVRRRSPRRALLMALTCLAIPSSARADELENYQRLQSMPRERRVALAENLERFDKLDPAEQSAIRKLDAQIARKDPVEQARYRALLRRYHLWVNGLSNDQKSALQAAPTAEARFALARKYRIKEAQGATPTPKLAGIRVGDYGLVGPFEVAHRLKIWDKLDASQKAQVEKQQDRRGLFKAIQDQPQAAGVKFERFPASEEAFYLNRLETDPEFQKMFNTAPKKGESASKKAEAASKKGDTPQRRLEHPFAEFLYFEDHPPRPVKLKDLERFSAKCPAWLHAMTDPLSPDDAREYMTILYRLIYPAPQEMPESKPGKSPQGPASRPSPASKKATNTGPT